MGLDIDGSGRKAAKQLATSLRRKGIDVQICIPADGKDWSAAYRLHGAQSLAPLREVMASRLVCDRCGVISSADMQIHGDKPLCSHCVAFIMPLSVEADRNAPCFCGSCLDLDKEIPAPYEYEDFMYCAEHHLSRRLLIASANVFIAQCPDLGLQVREVYHVSQRAEIGQRALEEYR
jgi:hypothetical protein